MTRQLKLTLTRSLHGRAKNHRACARGLGLRRIHAPVLVTETPENRGMIDKIRYMLKIEDAGSEAGYGALARRALGAPLE